MPRSGEFMLRAVRLWVDPCGLSEFCGRGLGLRPLRSGLAEASFSRIPLDSGPYGQSIHRRIL
jgi:hypothetical protein